MKVVYINFRRFFSCFSFFVNLVKKILFRGRQRKPSGSADDTLPTSVVVANDSTADADKDGGSNEWEDWGKMEEFSVKVEPTCSPQQLPSNDDLFQDMTPVFQKTKKIIVKKKKVYSDESSKVEAESASNRLKFDVSYPPVEPELGMWTEDSITAWDDEGVSEKDIEWQTEKLKKERKQAERERRALEQQKRREEKEAHKVDHKKPHGHFGVRLSS